MTSRKILGEEPMTMSDVKLALDNIKTRDTELNFRAGKTHEYLEQFVKLGPDKTKKLVSKLNDLEIPRVRDIHLIKLADLLPTSQNDVKVVLQGYPITVSIENCKKIADLISEFVEKEAKTKKAEPAEAE